MYVKEIWRYPVKSMAGEQLQQAAVGVHGIEGDRVIHVRNGQGKLVTARTYPGLLGHHAKLDLQGNSLVDGRPWNLASVLADVRKIVGPDAELIRDEARIGSISCRCWWPSMGRLPLSAEMADGCGLTW